MLYEHLAGVWVYETDEKEPFCQLFRTPYNSDETAGLLRCDNVLYLAEIPSRITMTMPMIGIWA